VLLRWVVAVGNSRCDGLTKDMIGLFVVCLSVLVILLLSAHMRFDILVQLTPHSTYGENAHDPAF
jgi:hypothetical protein